MLRKVSTAAGTNVVVFCFLVCDSCSCTSRLLSLRCSTQLRTSWAGSMQCHAPGCMWHAQYSESRNAYAMLSSNIRRSSTTSNPAATLPNLPGVRATMQSLSSPHAPSSRETPPCSRCSVSGCPCLWTRQKHCHILPAVDFAAVLMPKVRVVLRMVGSRLRRRRDAL